MEESQSNPGESSKKRASPEVAAAARKRETLLLAQIHLQYQLQASEHPRHREMIENALVDLEKQLAELGGTERAEAKH